MRPQLAGLLLVTGICAGARTATADGAADVVVARTLFADARTLADAGHYEEACPKFEESRRLLAGVGTIYNLADCYEHVGRTASAWATFLDAAAAAASAGEGEREKVARTRAAALEPRLTRLRIRTNPADSALPGLTIHRSRSGEDRQSASVVNRPQWNVPVPLDPGAYLVSVAAPSKAPWESMVQVAADAGSIELELPALADVAPGPAPKPPAGARRTHHLAAAALAGTAIVGLGIGTYFGVRAYGKKEDSAPECSGDACSPAGAQLRSDGVASGNVSTVAFACSGVALALAAIVWLTAPAAPARTSIGLGPFGVSERF